MGPDRGRCRMAVPALCAAVLCVGLAVGVLVRMDPVSLAASVPTQALTAPVPTAPVSTAPVFIAPVSMARPSGPPVEDVATLPVGQQYVWPSGVGLVVAPPTVTAPSRPGGL